VRWDLSARIDLKNDRIGAEDAARQMRTAAEILQRLAHQPGVILADEVGMGKTYVALAVAVSVVESTRGERPVVIQIPASVQEKWPREWDVFRQYCLREGDPIRTPAHSVNRGADFLRLLDDAPDRRNQIVFVTHEALTSSLKDPFIRLALISRALRRQALERQRQVFPRWAGALLNSRPFRNEAVVEALLHHPPLLWKATYEKISGVPLDDDPVPTAIIEALDFVDLDPLVEVLEQLPIFSSANIEQRLRSVREGTRTVLNELWKVALKRTRLDLPLLIMDEAHHLKNPYTRLAGLFANPDENGVGEDKGVLGGVFERMLFLTATPFQLSHAELIQIIRRFEGINWSGGLDRDRFRGEVELLSAYLDRTQAAALRLDRAWGKMRVEGDVDLLGLEALLRGEPGEGAEGRRQVGVCIKDLESQIRETETILRPWVIRHVRPDRAARRSIHPGRQVLDETADARRGLDVSEGSVLPFLLAARAQALVAAAGARQSAQVRAFFAEGLASSFEAYRETRQRSAADAIDEAAPVASDALPDETDWYLQHIDAIFDDDSSQIWGAHPKINATTQRVKQLWLAGEKVLVFCFYRATGRALRRHISAAIQDEILRMGAEKLGLSGADRSLVGAELESRGKRFFDSDAPITRFAQQRVGALLMADRLSAAETEKATGIVMRFLRTPSFLVRYMDLSKNDPRESLEEALSQHSAGHLSLREQIERFRDFAASRVGSERDELFEALKSLQTWTKSGAEPIRDDQEEDVRRGPLLANVRLANGAVKSESRRRMMLCFNTVFFPEVLIASSVLGEGVDLHLNCRHVIHHDLDWNPSVLEQRTGRLDRIGSMAEATGSPINVFEPFVEGTQDEKVFRVVKDRERWFNVVMGQQLELDEWSTERLASRLPLPESIAARLTVRLGLEPRS
jgi:hypothetical protein